MLLCQRNELISASHKNTFYVKPEILMSNSQNNLGSIKLCNVLMLY